MNKFQSTINSTGKVSVTKNRTPRISVPAINIFLIFIFLLLIPGREAVYGENAKYIILMISDGWGAKHVEAANKYTGTIPLYQGDQNWTKYWMSTFPYGGSYDSNQAWTNFNYVLTGYTDSAAAATALYTGSKTYNGRITVSADGSTAFLSIGEVAKEYGMAVGAISTVPVSSPTPGAWVAHNDDRGNTFAIADEGLFGNPNTTGTISTDPKYGGGHGPTMPAADVLIGAGGAGYISSQILTKLRNENGQPGKHALVERQAGVDGGNALMSKANDPATYKLAGLFDQVYHNANDSGYNAENPTLSESTLAALKVLGKNPNGFVLMIEGGAVDWASSANNMNQMIGEQKDYDNAVQTVINWVNDPSNDSDWSNTLVIVTGDHECGYLTKGPGVFPDQSLGTVNSATLGKEKIVSGTGGRRASWEDTNGNNIIDAGETVYWQWNSGGHSNTLVPLYARGAGSELFAEYATHGPDIKHGYYIDNTDVFQVMDSSISDQVCTETGSVSINPGQTLFGNPVDLTSIVQTSNTSNMNYTVTEPGSCPAQTNASIITKQDTWKYNGANNGNIGTTWKNVGYDDSGWSTGSGIFGYGETYITTPIGAPGQMSVYFRKTFTICNPGAVTSLRFNATYDDGIAVYINGTLVIAQGVTGNPPVWNGGAAGHESNQAYQTFNLDAYTGLLVPGTNVIAAGSYNIDNVSSDLVFDGELVINNNVGDSTLFTGNSAQAQSVNTTGWTNGGKNLEVIADDAVCLTPLPSANDTFTFNSGPPCTETGYVSITPGQSLSGNPVDLTSIVQTGNAANLYYTVTEPGSCPARVNASIITKRDTWKYNGAGNGNIGTTWKDSRYDDSGWSTGSGIFGYGETYINTLIGATGQMSMYFRKTFTICDANAVTSLKFYASYDDGIAVYINGTLVIAQGVTGNPPVWNGGAVNHESNNSSVPTIPVYTEFNLDSYIGQLVSGDNVIAVGIYNIDNVSSDLVFDGELLINNNAGDSTLFTGNSAQAQSVNTTGWTNGGKNLEVTADDAVCLTSLLPVNDTFTFNSNATPSGITVTPTSGLVTTEAGSKAIFSVVLNAEPASMVTIDLICSDTTEGKVLPATLTFSPENWNIAQPVTVTGVNDDIADSDQNFKIITQAAVSTDSKYNGIDPNDVSVTNLDDDTPGIIIDPSSGLVTAETGSTAGFTIKLNSQPEGDVTIDLSSSDMTEGSISTSSLTFIASNWNIAQSVTVTGVDDFGADGNQAYLILTHPAISGDPAYNGLDPIDVSVVNNDNEEPGIKVNPTSGLTTTENGSKATFSIVLNTAPSAKVTIDISSSDITEGRVSPATLTFTPDNWNRARTITITGVDDLVYDGTQSYKILTHTAVSTDSSYNGLNAADVSVMNSDNESRNTLDLSAFPLPNVVTRIFSFLYDLIFKTLRFL